MINKKRLRFFCPLEKKEKFIQTICLNINKKELDFEDLIRNKVIKDILTSPCYPVSKFYFSIPNLVKNNLLYYINNLNHDRFDILSPSFNDQMQVYFDFCLIFQTDKIIFQCENTSVEIDERVLDMIYNRIIPRDFELFPKSKLHKTFLIAKLIDERRDPSSFIFLKMRVEPSLKSKESQKYLLRAFPVICCDSSPNVGRMMSLIDHREKMWNIKPKIVHEEPKVEEVSVMKTSQIKHIISDEEKMFDLSTLELIFNKK